jgi:hypothetical protein
MSDAHVHDNEAALVLTGASAALDDIAQRLISLHDQWKASGASPTAVGWIETLIADAGWWSGRLLAQAGLDQQG